MQLLHEEHMDITKTLLKAKEIFYWPGLTNEVIQFINRCSVCERFAASNIKEPLIPHELPSLPFQKLGIDIMTCDGADYLIVIDYFSKWLDILKLRFKTSKEIQNKLINVFSTHSVPEKIVADTILLVSGILELV